MNADAVIGQTGNLLSHNMFAYCGNNPVNNEDPGGFFFKKILNTAKKVVTAVKNTVMKVNAAPKPTNIVKNSVKLQATIINTAAQTTKAKTSHLNGTFTSGIGSSVAFGGGGTGGIGVSRDLRGNVAIQPFGGWGGATPNAGISHFAMYTNAESIRELEGRAVQVGGSGGLLASVGADYVFNEERTYSGIIVSGGASLMPGELHGEYVYTGTLFEFNIYDIYDKAHKLIMQW